jgi:hypothetical protein
MSSAFQAGSEVLPGYRLVRPKTAPEGVDRWELLDANQRRFVARLVRLRQPLNADEALALDALREIRHPHIMPLLAIVEAPGILGLVSPYFETTLAQRLEDCRAAGFDGMPLDEWGRALEGAAQGLDELNHARPLPSSLGGDPPRHGCLRPENLVLDSGVVRVIDGGVNAILGDRVGDRSESSPPWKAPEQLALGTANDRSDQYSLAASFYCLRFGRSPLPPARTAEERLARPPDLNGIPPVERPVVERALAKDPLKRWPSSCSFASAWSSALNGALAAPVRAPSVAAPANVHVFPSNGDSGTARDAMTFEPVGARAAVAVVPAPPVAVTSTKTSRPSRTAKPVPVAKPAGALQQLDTAHEQETEEDLLTPESIKGWAWSFAMHAVLLLILALWVANIDTGPKVKVLDTRLAGSPSGSEFGDQLKGGLGLDVPVETPEFAPPADQLTTFTSLPLAKLNLDSPSVNTPSSNAAQKAAGNAGGSPLGKLGQAGNGDGFGVAKFGQGGEKINGVQVKVGDPQFTLIWNSRADIDLHVLEPGGAHIYWESRNGDKGGELDVDDVDGYGPENVYWVQGLGPPGEYKWYVHYYGGLGGVSTPTQWKVRLKHDNDVKVFTGKLNQIGDKSKTYEFKMDPPKDQKPVEASQKDMPETK